MKKKVISVAAGIICFSQMLTAQFAIKDVYFESTGVSNQGLVAGYVEWSGPYSLWNPETGEVTVINGLAPGNGIGGRATFSIDGMKISGTSQGAIAPEMSYFDVLLNTWVPVGSLGIKIDNNLSNAYIISGDGTTLAGNAWADTTGGISAHTHGVAWNAQQGVMDLGTLFPGRSTRVNAASADGSVLVGWQDFNGPWKSAVWRKNASGTYDVNSYILLVPSNSASDEFNQMGECSAVSSDGNWIGGVGDFANNNEPWIWSEATGVINLGTLNGSSGMGYVAGINQNGTLAVGRIQGGMWDPDIPFIWTPASGIQNLNDYATTTLGVNLGSKQLYAANCLSENGDYIAGYGVDTETFEFFTYRLNRATASLSINTMPNLFAFPNPTENTTALNNAHEVSIQISNVEGKLVKSITLKPNEILDLSEFSTGVYYVQYSQIGTQENQVIKIVKK